MSDLAKSLAAITPAASERLRMGPTGACQGVYPADLEDWGEVERIRKSETWRGTQRIVDAQLGIAGRVPNDKFRYHWRRKCWCWPDDLRLS